MSRQSLISALKTYRTLYPAESATVDRYIKFVNDFEDCFERSQQSGHVTGSAWLLNQAGTHVLLTHHRKLNRWLQLGGHADGNDDVLAVAMKEAKEESGIESIVALSSNLFDIDIHGIPTTAKEPAHFHYDARFLLQTENTDSFIVSDESHALEWIALEHLAERTDEISMLRMASKTARHC